MVGPGAAPGLSCWGLFQPAPLQWVCPRLGSCPVQAGTQGEAPAGSSRRLFPQPCQPQLLSFPQPRDPRLCWAPTCPSRRRAHGTCFPALTAPVLRCLWSVVQRDSRRFVCSVQFVSVRGKGESSPSALFVGGSRSLLRFTGLVLRPR